MKVSVCYFACLLVSPVFLLAADEPKRVLESPYSRRPDVREAIEKAWEKKSDEPVIPKIKLTEGTAFEFIQAIEEAVGEKSTSPIVVAIQATKLHSLRVKQVDLTNVTLSAAMAVLSDLTKLQTSKRYGVWWIEDRIREFSTRTFRLSPEDMKGIGLEFSPAPKPGESGHAVARIGGKKWPDREDESAAYFPSSQTFVVRLAEGTMAELDALLLLRKAGYEGLQVKK